MVVKKAGKSPCCSHRIWGKGQRWQKNRIPPRTQHQPHLLFSRYNLESCNAMVSPRTAANQKNIWVAAGDGDLERVRVGRSSFVGQRVRVAADRHYASPGACFEWN